MNNNNDALAHLMRSNSVAGAPAAAPQQVHALEPRSLSAPTYLPQLTAGNARSERFEHVGGSSTRVLAPPGGASQISFGGYGNDDGARVGGRRGRTGMGSAMPATHAAAGYSSTARETPRSNVLRPPGGPSSLELFGGYGGGGAQAMARPNPVAAPSVAPSVAPPVELAASPSAARMEDLLAQRRQQRQAQSDDFEARVAARMAALRGEVAAPVQAPAQAPAQAAAPSAPVANYAPAGQAPAISANSYANGANQNCGNVMTGRSTTRVAQAPGGTSQITFGGGNFGGDSAIRGAPAASGQASFNNPVAARVSANSYANGANQNCGNVMTGRSTTRVAQAPGGTSQITFGGGNFGAEQASFNNPVAARVSANSYANGANQNCGNVMTGRSTTRVAQAPGGTSQITFGGGNFGGDSAAPLRRGGRAALGPLDSNAPPPAITKLASQSMPASRSMGARVGNISQNCGNSILGRQSTRVCAPPGGGSSISFGDGSAASGGAGTYGAMGGNRPAGMTGAVSANSYASGANQNCGNVMTGRSTTRIHAPPGGTSQVVFG